MVAIEEDDLCAILQKYPFNFKYDAAVGVQYNPSTTWRACEEHVDHAESVTQDRLCFHDVHNDPVITRIIQGSVEPQASVLRSAGVTKEQYIKVH